MPPIIEGRVEVCQDHHVIVRALDFKGLSFVFFKKMLSWLVWKLSHCLRHYIYQLTRLNKNHQKRVL